MLEKTQACDNNPEESSATKLRKHAASFYSLFTHFSYDSSKSKHNFYRGADCMKKFCRDLKKHAAEIISYFHDVHDSYTNTIDDNNDDFEGGI